MRRVRRKLMGLFVVLALLSSGMEKLQKHVENFDIEKVVNKITNLFTADDIAELKKELGPKVTGLPDSPDVSKMKNKIEGFVDSKEEDIISQANDVTVTFIDVGQGDCILISDNGENMLIDTGLHTAYDNVQTVLQENGVNAIDALVLTHPDADHIQSAPEIISDYNVETVYMSTAESDSETYSNLMTAAANIETIYPKAGDYIEFGNSSYQVVGPMNEYSDTNSCSLMLRMVNGEDEFLFTGDATGEETDDILAAGYDVSADVYKMAHHGSANEGCNNETFFSAINPQTVVVSCGYQNDYGHPHKESMSLVENYNCNLYRTDLQGTISCKSTGNGITWSVEPTTVFLNGNSL